VLSNHENAHLTLKSATEVGMDGWVRGASDRKLCRCGAPRDYIIKSGERKGLLHSYCLTCRNAMVLASARRGKEAKVTSRFLGDSDRELCARCKKKKRDYIITSGRRKGLLHSYCLTCRNAQGMGWIARNPARAKDRQKKWWSDNPGRKVRALMKRYGKDEVWYAKQLAKQRGVCAICKKPETRRAYRGNSSVARLGLDHHHGTRRVRGLLCSKCNWKLGILEDGPWVKAAMRYLAKY
jgi:hypothetical protein